MHAALAAASRAMPPNADHVTTHMNGTTATRTARDGKVTTKVTTTLIAEGGRDHSNGGNLHGAESEPPGGSPRDPQGAGVRGAGAPDLRHHRAPAGHQGHVQRGAAPLHRHVCCRGRLDRRSNDARPQLPLGQRITPR